MRDKGMERFSTYEPFYVVLGDKRIADIVITSHARIRYMGRVQDGEADINKIAAWMWECLKQNRITPYYRNEQDVYLIDEDIVVVAEFSKLESEVDLIGNALHKMIIVTYLGKMSETIELRDLKSYYSWLRHSRRMTLVKNTRKRK
ncbi:hypothetical protein [Paenibacillus macquariensis]|uniref:Periplasmic protein n=1 Tax=Paenibacillus macquariensis TaxID=948756 RepID=A0ABY1JL35_9BACL|nr:hypothetical protein [Paenibacillus macquariensis]MEC0090067.1 hypothetical protein [Paenibacillus macquariensis]OAB31053.1 hypothetical protein PMSM_20210 [Paenibacillus macquariensis subsp. macquariensis]SIQ37076.1 hypothetical protein SAMN05421578_101452 [Paenibacillus macquariensis]